MPTRYVFALLSVPFLAVLACSRGQRSQEEQRQAVSGKPPATSMARQSLLLHSMHESDIIGEATLVQEADTLAVTLGLEHLTPGDEYRAYIYHGRCDAQGPKAAPLKSVLASVKGTGSSSSRVPEAKLRKMPTEGRHEGFFIQVLHPNGTPAACVDLPAVEPAAT